MIAGVRRLLSVLALLLGLCACAGDGAPTYTTESLSLPGCPGGRVHAERPLHFSFRLENTSNHRWQAAYLLLQPAGAIRTALKVPPGHQAGGIGGYVTRVARGLGAHAALTGTITAALKGHGSASFKLGAWGAPGNSVAEPSQMPARFCTLTR